MGSAPSLLPALAVLAGVGLLGACSIQQGGPGTPPDPEPTTAASSSTSEPTGPARSAPEPPEYAEAVAFARAQVHERYGHPLEEIELVTAEPVQWPDSSLGCPRTDRTYEPGPVPGYRVVLRWGDVRFAYHGAEGELPFHCMFLDG